MSTTFAWEAGLTCDGPECGREFVLGEEVIFWYGQKLCPSCAAKDAAGRREAACESEDVLAVVRRHLDAGGRVILTRRQLRELITLACADPSFIPVHKPDAGHGRQQWYGRLPGWAAARVADGLSPQEVAGLWADFLDVGRMPPIRHSDVASLLGVISAPVPAP